LLALDQPPDVVRLSGVYIRRCVFGLWPMMIFESTRRFLQCQGIARPIAIVAVISDALHPLWNYLFIYVCGFGFEGAGAPMFQRVRLVLCTCSCSSCVLCQPWPRWLPSG
jgi:Na+-driven multidrug efflux pump